MTVLWKYEDRADPLVPGVTIMDRHADRWFQVGACAGGSFLNKLFDLLAVADTENTRKLRGAFHEEVGAWSRRCQNAMLVEIPYSEAAMELQIAGERRWVKPVQQGMAQLLYQDGQPYSFPITRGEAGLPYD